jgi:predicted TIM-barrel fold metal-dependent hydrolase
MKAPRVPVVLCIAAIFLSGCGQRAPESEAEAQAGSRLPIIDMHMHVFDAVLLPDGTPIPLPCEPQPCDGVAAAAKSNDAILQMTLEQMDKYNVVKAFLSSDSLSNLDQWVKASPDRFVPSLLIWEPGKPGVDALRAEYSAGRLSGFLGEIATQYYGFAPDAVELDPYFALAEELDLPVLIHTLGVGQHRPGFRVAAGNPLLLEGVMVRHPNLRLYVEDAGYPFLAEMTAMMYQYPQLYADLSTITWLIPRDAFHDYLRSLTRAGLGKRLMFGSDQVLWPEAIGRGVEAIESADFLTAEQRRDIFYNNAARFLRLGGESNLN